MLVPLSSGFVMMLHKSQAAVKILCSSTSKKLKLLKSTAFWQFSFLNHSTRLCTHMSHRAHQGGKTKLHEKRMYIADM